MVHNEFGFLENSDEAEVVCPKIEKLDSKSNMMTHV